MRESIAIIERVRRNGPHWQHLDLAVEPELAYIQPGQVLLARLGDSWSPYLREQWVPFGFNDEEGVLIVERPMTEAYNPGDEVNILGPIGAPILLKPTIRNLLLVAFDYQPTRLMPLVLQAIRQNMSVVLVLTRSAQEYPLTNLPTAVEVITTPNETEWANQADTLKWADQVYAVASPIFCEEYYGALWRATIQARQAAPESFLQGIYPLPMPCGTGACLACLVRRKGADHLACVQGPCFDLSHMHFAT